MKKKTGVLLGALAILTAGITMGAGNKKQGQKYQDKQEFVSENPQYDINDLEKQKQEYDARVAYYKDFIKRFEKLNSEYDNMDSLFNLINSVDYIVTKIYDNREQDFVKHASNSLRKFMNSEGKIKSSRVSDTGGYTFYIPRDRNQWIDEVRGYSDKIADAAILESEYKELSEFWKSINDFKNFVYTDFITYFGSGPKSREHNKRQIIPVQQNIVIDGSKKNCADFIIDGKWAIRKKNTQDNVNQDDVIDVLMFLLKGLVVSADAETTAVYDDLTKKVFDVMTQIRAHNELESRIITYQAALKEVERRIIANAISMQKTK